MWFRVFLTVLLKRERENRRNIRLRREKLLTFNVRWLRLKKLSISAVLISHTTTGTRMKTVKCGLLRKKALSSKYILLASLERKVLFLFNPRSMETPGCTKKMD
jgi:hypothetical protein